MRGVGKSSTSVKGDLGQDIATEHPDVLFHPGRPGHSRAPWYLDAHQRGRSRIGGGGRENTSTVTIINPDFFAKTLTFNIVEGRTRGHTFCGW